MKLKNIGATLLVLALGFGGAAIATSPASAHTGDLSVTAVCNTVTGEYDFTAKLTVSQTNLPGDTNYRVGTSNFEGTPTSANNMPGGIAVNGSGVYDLTTFSLPGTTTGYGPWVYAFTKFSDKFTIGSDGQLLRPLAGDCAPPPVVKTDVTGKVDFGSSVCAFDNHVTNNTAILSAIPGVKYSYTFNGGASTPVAAGTYNTPDIQAGTYIITAEADDPALYNYVGTSSWTLNFTAADPACVPPVIPPAQPDAKASIVPSCGAAEVTLTNPLGAAATRLTASYVIYVNGTFYGAYAVAADDTEVVNLTWPEDTGKYDVRVETGPAFGSVLLAEELQIDSDCIPPVIVVPPTNPPTTNPPVVPPTTLAATGVENPALPWLVGTFIVLFGLTAFVFSKWWKRRKETRAQQ